jgi:hypothetical protein
VPVLRYTGSAGVTEGIASRRTRGHAAWVGRDASKPVPTRFAAGCAPLGLRFERGFCSPHALGTNMRGCSQRQERNRACLHQTRPRTREVACQLPNEVCGVRPFKRPHNAAASRTLKHLAAASPPLADDCRDLKRRVLTLHTTGLCHRSTTPIGLLLPVEQANPHRPQICCVVIPAACGPLCYCAHTGAHERTLERISTAEAARRLGVSVATVKRRLNAGELHGEPEPIAGKARW